MSPSAMAIPRMSDYKERRYVSSAELESEKRLIHALQRAGSLQKGPALRTYPRV
jgi:hypothetical protein